MKSILSLLIVLFSMTGLFAQNVCTVKILFAINKSNPPSYTFKTDPQTTGAKYSWAFGDNTFSDSPNPIHTFSKGGSYVIHVKVSTGSGNDAKICYGELSAQFEGSTVTTSVVPCKVRIIGTRSSTNPLAFSFKSDPSSTASTTKYFWSFGDDTPTSDTRLPSHTYSKAGTYVVKVKVTNGAGADAAVCYGELSLKVEATTVTPPVAACTVKIVSTKNSTTPASYTFTTDPQTAGAKYYWTFGDNTISDSPNPSHTFSKAGTYSVVVKVVSGDKTCTGELKTTFDGGTLSPTPVTYTGRGKVTSLSSVTGCGLVITTMENNVRLIPAKISVNFVLKEGQYVEFTYQKYAEKITTCKEGIDIIILTIKEITTAILPNCKGPINLLLFDPTNNLCNGSATVKLLDEAGKEITNVKYLWSDGRTGSSAGTLCPGKLYTVQATIENVCQKTTSFTLLSKPLWQSTSVDGVNNFTVLAPVDGVQYEWNFGDGVTKIGPVVSYNFQKDGIYDVQLKALSMDGVSESTKQVVVMKSVATTDVINKSEVDLYPNPAKEIIRIDFKNPAEGTLKVEIKSLSGRSVYIEQITNDGSSHADINIQNLNAGMYVLRISNDQRIIGERKFIKAN
jgi:PKD repeat protein